MSPHGRILAVIGTLWGLIGVALGAYGSHGLGPMLAERIADPAELRSQVDAFMLATRYQIMHGLALWPVAWVIGRGPGWAVVPAALAGWLFVLGTVLFAGTIYAKALIDWQAVGPLAPVGGMMLILGWLCLAGAVVSTPRR